MNHRRKNVLIAILVSICLIVSLPVSASSNRAPSQEVSEVYEQTGTWYYLQTDGRVYARGSNESYQLGLGKDWNETYFLEPRYIGGMADVVEIAALPTTTVVLKKSGNVYYLGDGVKGSYGPFDPKMTWVPERIPGITDVIDISGTYRTLLMLKKDGTLWSIGSNRKGIAGIGSSAMWVDEPQQVKGLPKIKAVSAGEQHALALDVNGEVWAWGRNLNGDAGILGTGSSQENVLKPEKVKGLDRVVQIDASGGGYSAALKADGTVWIWGENFSGMLVGNKRPSKFTEPFKVPGLTDVKAISAGGNYMIALKNDGTVWTWGHNQLGQLGLGLQEDEVVELPMKVSGLSDVEKIAAGTVVGVAIQADGTVWTMGVDAYNDPEYKKNYYKNPKWFVPQKSELPKLDPPQPQLTDKELKDIVSRKKTPGEISVVINKKVIDGDSIYYDPKSKQRLIDLSVLSDHLGVHIFKKVKDNHFVLVREDKKIEIVPGSAAAVVNGKKVNMEAPFMFKNNTYWVPLKFFANLLANPDLMPPNTKPVQWIEKQRIIQITTQY